MIRYLSGNIHKERISYLGDSEHYLRKGRSSTKRNKKKRTKMDTRKKGRERTGRREGEKTDEAVDTNNKKGKRQWDRMC